MEDEKAKRYMWCFWIAVVIILAVFVIPVETIENGPVTINYTLWNKITESGPSSGEIRLNH
jgi:ABC-type uncharacterized transport system permease subunit